MESWGGTGVLYSPLCSVSVCSGFIPAGHTAVGAGRSAAGVSLLRAVLQPPGEGLP